LTLSFADYASRLEATLKAGSLDGQFMQGGGSVPFHAVPYQPDRAEKVIAPPIAGVWEIEVKRPQGDSAWRFIVHQRGAKVSATILRLDGDTGTLSGSYQKGKFVLSHFAGERPYLLYVTQAPDGSLRLELFDGRRREFSAYRPAAARAKGYPEPGDPSRQVRIKNPDEPFRFSFPDLTGKQVANTGARFQGKVLIVALMGSWCPNCHDEAPFLAELYRQYHAQGLEIVALDFESAEQLQDPSRLRAFISRYHLPYTVLLAGQVDEADAKLPQVVNLNSWPTTFFLGRDGKVRATHTGFAGAASAEFHAAEKKQITALVERLLAEK